MPETSELFDEAALLEFYVLAVSVRSDIELRLAIFRLCLATFAECRQRWGLSERQPDESQMASAWHRPWIAVIKSTPVMYTTDRLFFTRSLILNGDIAFQSCEHGEPFCWSMVAKENMLLLVLRGSINIKHGNVSYTVPKSNLVFLRKDIFVECSGGSRPGYVEQTDFVAVYLKDDFLKDFIKNVRISIFASELPSPVVAGPMDERLVKCVESLEAYFADGASTDEYLVRIKLLELLFNLANTNKRICTQLLMSLRVQFKADLASTVEENLMTPKSLTQLAELCGRSLSSFKRDFLAIYNLPPSTWVRQRRLEKARDLLMSTTMTVTDVCYTLGFESVAHFSRLFKSTFGCPPSRLRTSVARD